MLNILRKLLGIKSIKSAVMQVINERIEQVQSEHDKEVIELRDKLQDIKIQSIKDIKEFVEKQAEFVKMQKQNYKSEKALLAEKHVKNILSKIL